MIYRVLIYRLGSLGDTIIALPALRLVARAFPHAERWMLTNFSAHAKAAPMSKVLEGTGLIHEYIEYPVKTRSFHVLLGLRNQILRLRPDVLVYLTESRGLLKTVRDAMFFRVCGIPQLIGLPYSADMRVCRKVGNGLYEYEGVRLARCIHELGEAEFNDPAAFDLCLSVEEREVARVLLEQSVSRGPVFAVSIGSKWEVNDWGDANWSALLLRLNKRFPDATLVTLGAEVERTRSVALLNVWAGTSIDLCGRLSVRESAAVLERCCLFVGHDSGPMHLAAAVGTPCVAVFSARNPPGVWFPYGAGHKPLYPHAFPREGGRAARRPDIVHSIESISVEEVEKAAGGVLRSTGAMPARVATNPQSTIRDCDQTGGRQM